MSLKTPPMQYNIIKYEMQLQYINYYTNKVQ